MEKFTKGEWCISGEKVGVFDDSDTQSYGMIQEVAFVDMYNFEIPECMANAHLIAAAPDMYAMLNGLQLSVADSVKCEALLAKARGEHE